jgi:hypothetical protein
MQIFVSIHLIPPDLKFLPDANPPNFSNEEQVIERGAMVRIKIMGLKMDVKDIVSLPPPSRLLLFLPNSNISLRSAPSRRIILVSSDFVILREKPGLLLKSFSSVFSYIYFFVLFEDTPLRIGIASVCIFIGILSHIAYCMSSICSRLR